MEVIYPHLPLLGKDIYSRHLDHAYVICSNFALRKKEIGHLKKVFPEKNDYPKWVINQVLHEVEEKHKTSVNNVNEELQVSPVTNLKPHVLVLPYRKVRKAILLSNQ